MGKDLERLKDFYGIPLVPPSVSQVHLSKKQACMVVMHGSILSVTIPPGILPGIWKFFLTWWSIPHPQARKKRRFPTPGTPH